MSSGTKVSVATWLNKKLKLELTALDMDGMSAVMEVDGKSKIYSTVMLRSDISPSCQLSRKTAVYLGVGGNWIRGISMSDRSLKGFLNNFKNDEDEPGFRPTPAPDGGIQVYAGMTNAILVKTRGKIVSLSQ